MAEHPPDERPNQRDTKTPLLDTTYRIKHMLFLPPGLGENRDSRVSRRQVITVSYEGRRAYVSYFSCWGAWSTACQGAVDRQEETPCPGTI